MPKIIKSKRKLESWAAVRALDAIAIPLVYKYGVSVAYQIAADRIDAQSR